MVDWIRRSIARQLIVSVVLVLVLMVGVSLAVAHYTIAAIETSYEATIFSEIIPTIQHLGDNTVAEAQQSITEAQSDLGRKAMETATGLTLSHRTEKYTASDYRDHIKDRKVRGGIDRPGSLFIVPSDEEHVVWIYRGVHDRAGQFLGVDATAFATDNPGAIAEKLTGPLADDIARIDAKKGELADKQMALGTVKQVIGPTLDKIQASRLRIQAVKDSSRLQGAALLLVVAVLGGVVLALSLNWLAGRFVHQSEAIESIIAASDDPVCLATIIVPDRDRVDQLGGMARGIAKTVEVFQQLQTMKADQDRQRSDADLAKREALKSMAVDIENEIRASVDGVAERARQMCDNAQSLADSATRVSDDSKVVNGTAEQALQHAKTVATSADALSQSIESITAQVTRASTMTRNGVSAGEQTYETIMALSGAVGKIGDVARLISAIASQTNLLALNATIEAARAGDAGKGFAVVASEVKNLANQTARATDEIGAQIEEIKTVSANAVTAVRKTSETLNEINKLASAIAISVQEQGHATKAISCNVQQAAEASHDVSSQIAEVSGHAVTTGSHSGAVRTVADELHEKIEILRETLVRVIHSSIGDIDEEHGAPMEAPPPILASLPSGVDRDLIHPKKSKSGKKLSKKAVWAGLNTPANRPSAIN